MSFKKAQALTAVWGLILLLMLPNLLWLSLEVGSTRWPATFIITALIVPTLLLGFYFALLGRYVWIACLLMTPFAMLAPFECFYVYRYKWPSTVETLGTVFATYPGETIGYFGWLLLPLTLALLAVITLALVAVFASYRTNLRWSGRLREWLCISAVMLPAVLFGIGMFVGKGGDSHLGNGKRVATLFWAPIPSSYPFGVIPRFWEYANDWRHMRANADKLASFRFHATQLQKSNQREIYVLVIGESSRRDHWQLFGYDRPTNPELTQTRNLVKIPHMLASWPQTLHEVPLIITRKPVTDMDETWTEASILRAMQEAGFDTWWISNQYALGKYDSPFTMYAIEAHHQIFLNHSTMNSGGNYDEVLLQPLRMALKDDSNSNVFIVLHMMGSHIPYDLRYPISYRKFSPTMADGKMPASETNSYDNSILYTDHVLAKVIEILQQSGDISALWFESDHGEALPTPQCSLLGHGFGTRNEFTIPAFFWYSDSYAAKFPARLAQLEAHANEKVLSANSFESLIDMAGVDFPTHDPSWSLFSPQWHPRPRIVNSIEGPVDFDNARIEPKCDGLLPSSQMQPFSGNSYSN
jgi:glucan phosphoethanolaminetransferase (alkaline phosphatase superfamily)